MPLLPAFVVEWQFESRAASAVDVSQGPVAGSSFDWDGRGSEHELKSVGFGASLQGAHHPPIPIGVRKRQPDTLCLCSRVGWVAVFRGFYGLLSSSNLLLPNYFNSNIVAVTQNQ